MDKDSSTEQKTWQLYCSGKRNVYNYQWRELPQVKKFCRDKHVFAATKHVFCRDKSMFCRDKTLFVATKIILVAAPANEIQQQAPIITQWKPTTDRRKTTLIRDPTSQRTRLIVTMFCPVRRLDQNKNFK